MKILAVGATGTIGGAVAELLSQNHQVIAASRNSDVQVDLSNPASIRSMFETVGKVDAVVSIAGSGAFGPLDAISDDDFAFGLGNKLMGQINLVRFGREYVNDGGSMVLTSGILADHPNQNSVLLTTLNSAVEGFARAAALSAPRGIRINAVSPPLVRETAIKLGWGDGGVPAAEVARLYEHAVTSDTTGEVLQID